VTSIGFQNCCELSNHLVTSLGFQNCHELSHHVVTLLTRLLTHSICSNLLVCKKNSKL
jgi:hypothetical protein